MTLKILDPREKGFGSFRMVFDLNEGVDFEWYDAAGHKEPVDILILNHLLNPTNEVNYNYRLPIFMDVYHNFEDQIKVLEDCAKADTRRIVVTNARDFNIDHPLIVFNDFLFNRTKAYYSGYQFHPSTHKWYYTLPEDYTSPIHNVDNKTKIFVSLNRLEDKSRELYGRKRTVAFLKDMLHLGHLGCRDENLNLFAVSEVLPSVKDVCDLTQANRPHRRGGYVPPHNLYYQDTFVSMYCETNEFGSSFAATEKTFDPLIKGHFIFPFANQHFVRDLQTYYGFKLPDFIDYSYDAIDDKVVRFEAYFDEMKRLLSLDLDTWKQHWLDNYSTIEYNKSIFYNTPYHKVDYKKYLD